MSPFPWARLEASKKGILFPLMLHGKVCRCEDREGPHISPGNAEPQTARPGDNSPGVSECLATQITFQDCSQNNCDVIHLCMSPLHSRHAIRNRTKM